MFDKRGIGLRSLGGGLLPPSADTDLAYGQFHQPQTATQLEKFSKHSHSSPHDTPALNEGMVDYWKERYESVNKALQENEKHLEFLKENVRKLKISHDTDLANIQRTVFEQVTETYSSKTDDDLQIEIKRLRNGIISWAKKSAQKSLDHLSSEDLVLFSSQLREKISPEPKDDEYEEFFRKQKFLCLLLGSLLSHALHWEIIRNPFFFAKNPKTKFDSPEMNPGVFLDSGYIDMYAYMIEIDEVEAHQWRSERVREFRNDKQERLRELEALKPKALEDPPPVNEISDWVHLNTVHSPQQNANEMPKTLNRAPTLPITCQAADSCKRACELFVAGPAGKLIDLTKEDSQNQLDELFMRAGNLSLDIWSRKSSIKCCFARELENEVYAEDSKVITAHELFIPEDPSVLQGKRFSFLVHPLIEVYGTEEGQQYSVGRVLAPAMAWYTPS